MNDTGKRVFGAAGMLVAAMAISRILGYLRDVVIYAQFGQNRLTDAYNAAFSIPDFLYLLIVGGALSSAFIPVFSGYIAKEEHEEAWEVAWTVFHVVTGSMLLGIVVGMSFTPQLVNFLVPGFDAATKELTVLLTRIMFIQAFFMALSGISMAILNSHKHFLWPAVGSVLYNFGIIAVGYFLSRYYGIIGFSVGVVAGAMMYFAVQLPALKRTGMKYSFRLNLKHPGFRRILLLILPVLIGMSANQINLFVNQMLASTLSGGLVAALRSGQRLMMLPVGIFAVAIGVAIFPTLSEHAALEKIKDFKRMASLGLRTIFFVSLPSAAVLIVLRVPVIRFLFQQGEFTKEATIATSAALLFYAIGILGYASIQVLNRIFYALEDTRTPVITSVTAMIVNIVLNFLLLESMGHRGLALAYSVAGILNMVILIFLLWRKVGGMSFSRLTISFFQSMVGSIAAGLVSYTIAVSLERTLDMSYKLNQGLQVVSGMAAAVLVYFIISSLFKMEEASMARQMLSRRMMRTKTGMRKQ